MVRYSPIAIAAQRWTQRICANVRISSRGEREVRLRCSRGVYTFLIADRNPFVRPPSQSGNHLQGHIPRLLRVASGHLAGLTPLINSKFSNMIDCAISIPTLGFKIGLHAFNLRKKMINPQKAVNINCLKVFMKRLNRSMDDL